LFRTYDEARSRASKQLTDGRLAGVPFLLKDTQASKKGWPTRRASRFVPTVRKPHDSTLVGRYEAAGLIALGRTNMCEFGLLPLTEPKLYGPTRNPWNSECTRPAYRQCSGDGVRNMLCGGG